MKHEDSLPVLLGRGGDLIDPMDPDSALAELESSERKRYFIGLREAARDASRQVVSPDDTFSTGRGLGFGQGGVQSLATYFNLETWSDPPTVVWTENSPFLRAHRNDEDLPPTVAPVAEHVSVRVVAHARTPWGHHVRRHGTCTTRGKHFWTKKGYNLKKYREGAEHICAGIAETRAVARAVKAALMIGGEEWEDGEFDADQYEERKRQKATRNVLEAAKQEWRKLLRRFDVTPEEERAFAIAIQDLPDDMEAWGPEEYNFAHRAAEANGRSIFRTAVRKVDAGPPVDDGRAPPPESNDPATTDPEPPSERAETEASESSEPAESGAEEEPEYPPEEQRKRRALIESIRNVCKMLGEDVTRAEQYAGDKWGDGTPIPLEELDTADLAQVDRALSEELSAGGAA